MSNEFLLSLYRKYAADLARVREQQASFYLKCGYLPEARPSLGRKLSSAAKRAQSYLARGAVLRPQLDDVEAELTYLLLREFRPQSIVEVSPCGGWSSTWILSAIRDNGVGHLYSFDLVDWSSRNIPAELAQGRRTFIQGPVQDNLSRLPDSIDYLFIDSDHSAQFAQWYIDNLFSRLKRGTPVSVHDVYHTADPSGFDSEGGVVIQWLEDRKINFFTASPAKNRPDYAAIEALKGELRLSSPIHRALNNSMIFFNMA